MDYFAINNNSYFEHHGRKGQKWGDRNGPPYPLDYSKLSAEEREEAKKKAIDFGNVEEAAAYKNRDYFTKQDLDNLINKYQTNQRLDELMNAKNAEKFENKIKKAKKFIKVFDTVNLGFKAAADITGNVNTLMNNIDKMTKNNAIETTITRDSTKEHKETIVKKDKNKNITVTTINDYYTKAQKKDSEKKELEKKQKEAEKREKNPSGLQSEDYDYAANVKTVSYKDWDTGKIRNEYYIIDEGKKVAGQYFNKYNNGKKKK